MAFAYVQRAASGALVGGNVVLTANTTVGNLVICTVTYGSGTSSATMTDSKGNTWTLCTRTTANRTISTFFSVLTTALLIGDTITPQFGGANNCIVDEYTGQSASPFDATNSTNNGGSVTSLSTGTTGTLAQANEMVYTVVAINATTTSTVPSGYTDRGSVVAGAITMDAADLVVSATTALNPSWSWTGGTNASAAVATFKIPSASHVATINSTAVASVATVETIAVASIATIDSITYP